MTLIIIIIETSHFSAMIVNPSGKQYDQHCGPSGMRSMCSGWVEIGCDRSSVAKILGGCLFMAAPNIGSMVGEPGLEFVMGFFKMRG